MGTTAARKAGWILENTRSVLAFELLTACQAIDIRRRKGDLGQGISPVQQAIYEKVRQEIDFFETDREIQPDIQKIEALMRSGALESILALHFPDFA